MADIHAQHHQYRKENGSARFGLLETKEGVGEVPTAAPTVRPIEVDDPKSKKVQVQPEKSPFRPIEVD
jgi:hypothetical protein